MESWESPMGSAGGNAAYAFFELTVMYDLIYDSEGLKSRAGKDPGGLRGQLPID
jgi:hypothetical protein